MVLITILMLSEPDRVSTYTGLDDYDTLFAARQGRGALDQVPIMSEQMIITTVYGNYTPYCKYGTNGKPIAEGDDPLVILHTQARGNRPPYQKTL